MLHVHRDHGMTDPWRSLFQVSWAEAFLVGGVEVLRNGGMSLSHTLFATRTGEGTGIWTFGDL